MVYNEWAAIITHQDEMDKALKMEEQKQNIIIKQKYMADLDQQRAGVAKKYREDKQMDAQYAVDMLEYQKQKDHQKAMTDDAKRQQLKEQVIQKQKESLAEKDKIMRDQKENQLQQQEMYTQQALRVV